jgi:hypothetical protein
VEGGAGPGADRLGIDVDSFVGEVCGRLKQGASYGYTRLLGYHPILATRADTRETLHIRLRKDSANTQKGIKRFIDELIARVETFVVVACYALIAGVGAIGIFDQGNLLRQRLDADRPPRSDWTGWAPHK